MEANHMSKRIARVEPAVTVIVGVDTHKHVHVAVAVDRLGARLGSCSVPANRGGYAELVAWARTLGAVEAFGIEGTGSYGAGLVSFVRRHGPAPTRPSGAHSRPAFSKSPTNAFCLVSTEMTGCSWRCSQRRMR